MKVKLYAETGATIMYAKGTSTNFSTYNGQELSLNDGEVIRYYARKNGCINSKTVTYEAKLAEPSTPEIKLTGTESTVAEGKDVTVGWVHDSRATSYVATLYDASDNSVVEEKEDPKPTASFTLKNAGEYYIQVIAKNDIGVSDSSNKVRVTAKAPLNVTFRDAGIDDEPGEVLSEMKVEYGTTLLNIDAPSRRGHVFSGWENQRDGSISKNSYLTSPIKEDTIFVAVYEKNKYKVKLFDPEGNLMDTKTVEYGDAVNTSSEEAKIIQALKTGHIFTGWQVTETTEGDSAADINFVDSDMEVRAVTSWAEAELPVIAEIEDPRQETISGTEYITATVKLYNDTSKDLSMYLISVLKSKDSNTGAEKAIYTDRKIVELPAGNGDDDPEKTITLRMKPDDIANVTDLEIAAVERKSDMTTGSAYSELASATVNIISDWDQWSEWSSTAYTASDNRQVEVRYHYRDKTYTYNGNDTLTGYTKESTEYYNFSTAKWQSTSYTKYGGYVLSAPAKSTNVTASYKDVNSYATTTAQWSYTYCNNKKNWYWRNSGGKDSSGNYTTNLLTVYSSKSLAASGYTKDSDGSYALPKTISTSSPGKLGTIYRIDYAGTANVNTFTEQQL